MPNGTLRSKVIRLAHERPDLRPHLLAALKEADAVQTKQAWLVLPPRDALSFGYVGPGAEDAASTLSTEVKAVLREIKQTTQDQWKRLGVLLKRNSAVDAQPLISRIAVAEPLRHTYMNLAEQVTLFFEKVPVGP